MSSSIAVRLGVTTIETTVTRETSEINRLVQTFLSNNNNRKRIIGLDTERAQKSISENETVLLQLCDGRYCLIVQLLPGYGVTLPRSLFNFLNLPEFTFVGIGINKSLKMLESEFGLTCKNSVEIRSPTLNLITNHMTHWKNMMGDIDQKELTSPVLDDWGARNLNKNQIKLAVSNAYLAYAMGNLQLN